MFNPQIIKERYASMYDEELIRIAKTEGAELTNEALIFLKEELQHRGISTEIIITEKENRSAIGPGSENSVKPETDFDLANPGLTYQKMMYDKTEEEPTDPAPEVLLTPKQIKEGLEINSFGMRLYGIIFLAGFAFTIGSVIVSNEGGRMVLAWGAMFIGGYKFVLAYFNWKKFKSIGAGMNVISGKKEEEGNDMQRTHDD